MPMYEVQWSQDGTCEVEAGSKEEAAKIFEQEKYEFIRNSYDVDVSFVVIGEVDV